MKYLILFLGLTAFSQEISRNTISVVGNATTTPNGYYVTQSVGQLSAIGSFIFNDKNIIQGYQQPTGYKSIDGSIEKEFIQLYPVPVIDKLNISFTKTLQGACKIELFDRLGRLVLSKDLVISDYNTSIMLPQIASSAYLLKLTTKNTVYYETIIKKD
jgi:hypothetical protein